MSQVRRNYKWGDLSQWTFFFFLVFFEGQFTIPRWGEPRGAMHPGSFGPVLLVLREHAAPQVGDRHVGFG